MSGIIIAYRIKNSKPKCRKSVTPWLAVKNRSFFKVVLKFAPHEPSSVRTLCLLNANISLYQFGFTVVFVVRLVLFLIPV